MDASSASGGGTLYLVTYLCYHYFGSHGFIFIRIKNTGIPAISTSRAHIHGNFLLLLNVLKPRGPQIQVLAAGCRGQFIANTTVPDYHSHPDPASPFCSFSPFLEALWCANFFLSKVLLERSLANSMSGSAILWAAEIDLSVLDDEPKVSSL